MVESKSSGKSVRGIIDWRFIIAKYQKQLRQFLGLPLKARFDKTVFYYPEDFPPQDPNLFNSNNSELYDVLLRMDGDVAVDIGAGVGSYCLRLAERFRQVIAFEPNVTIYEYLFKNVHANKAWNVKLEHLAVSSTSGHGYLKIPRRYNSGSTLAPNHYPELKYVDQYVVRTTSLDQYFNDYPGKLDLVKMDVENHELAVLNGAKETIAKHHPLLAVEVHGKHDSNCLPCRWLQSEYGKLEVHGISSDQRAHWVLAS